MAPAVHLAFGIVKLPKPSVSGVLGQRLPTRRIVTKMLLKTCGEHLDALAGFICDDSVGTHKPLTGEYRLAGSKCEINVAHNVEVTGAERLNRATSVWTAGWDAYATYRSRYATISWFPNLFAISAAVDFLSDFTLGSAPAARRHSTIAK